MTEGSADQTPDGERVSLQDVTKREEALLRVEEDTTYIGAIVDVAIGQYQVEWQRIGNMQQSAGILVATLAIIFTVLTSYFGTLSSASTSPDLYFDRILAPCFYVCLLAVAAATILLVLVIVPTRVKAIPYPRDLIHEAEGQDLAHRLGWLIRIFSDSLKDLHTHVETRQRRYARALAACSGALLLAGLLTLLFITRMQSLEGILVLYYLTLLLIGAVCTIIIATIGRKT